MERLDRDLEHNTPQQLHDQNVLYRITREDYVTASQRHAPDGYAATLHSRC
jgi:hypothetical protein